MVWCLLKQPRKLERLATFKLAENITLNAMNTVLNPPCGAVNKTKDLLPQNIEIIRNYFKYVPGILLNKLLTELMRQLLSADLCDFYPREDNTELSQRHVLDRILKVCFTNNLTYLSLSYEEMETFGALFVSCSSKLTGLTGLNLNIDVENDKDMEFCIIDFLKEFRSLKYLALSSCTDKILRCIAEKCTKLEKLDLNNYYLCKVNAIDMLTELPYLNDINLYESLAAETYEQLGYREINNRKREVLERIALRKQFDLKSYVNYGVITKLVVFEKYPLIQKLTFFQTYREQAKQRQNILETLNNLQNLRELDIYNYDFYKGQVKEVLQLVGNKLQKLKLQGVNEINLDALKHISLMCPHLEELSISCPLTKETVLANLDDPFNIEIPAFRKLLRLTLALQGPIWNQRQTKNFDEEFSSIFAFELSECGIY